MAMRIPASSSPPPSVSFSAVLEMVRVSLSMPCSPTRDGWAVDSILALGLELFSYPAQQVGDGVYRSQRRVGEVSHAEGRFAAHHGDAEGADLAALTQHAQGSEGMRVSLVVPQEDQPIQPVLGGEPADRRTLGDTQRRKQVEYPAAFFEPQAGGQRRLHQNLEELALRSLGVGREAVVQAGRGAFVFDQHAGLADLSLHSLKDLGDPRYPWLRRRHDLGPPPGSG